MGENIKAGLSVEARAAATRALRRIETMGGEVVEFKGGCEPRYATVDRYGRELERMDRGGVERLRDEGRLRLKRFERGGVVWGVAASAGAGVRAAYFDGDA